MFDRWESQWRRGFLGSSQFLSNWNIINPRRSWTLRVVILICLRAIIKDDEELWSRDRANAMLRNSFSANSRPWNGRGEVCHQCRWYETQCAIHFILYSLGFDRSQTFTERSKTKPKHFLEVRFSSVKPWFDRTESSVEHYSMIWEIMRKFWRQLRPGGMSFEQLPEPRVHFCDGYEQVCRRSSLSNRSLSCLSLFPLSSSKNVSHIHVQNLSQ